MFCRYTAKAISGKTIVYAIFLEWPKNDQLILGAPVTSPGTTVTMLGYHGNFSWKPHSGGGMEIQIPVIPINEMPNFDGWALKITGLTNWIMNENVIFFFLYQVHVPHDQEINIFLKKIWLIYFLIFPLTVDDMYMFVF